MAGKVLLGLLAAVAVTGSAVVFSGGGKSGGCPLSAGGCDATTATVTCSAPADEAPLTCCAAKSRAAACCEGMEDGLKGGGDAIAALTGGVCLGQ